LDELVRRNWEKMIRWIAVGCELLIVVDGGAEVARGG